MRTPWPAVPVALAAVLALGCRAEHLAACDELREAVAALSTSLQLTECAPGHGQVRVTARFEVDGSDAADIEAVLRAETGMRPLRFACCGWEPSGGGDGSLGESDGRHRIVSMHSDETLINDRSRWSEIPSFHVVVTVAEI